MNRSPTRRRMGTLLLAFGLGGLLAQKADAQWIGTLRGIDGVIGSAVAAGDGGIVYSNSIHQHWFLAEGFDAGLNYLHVIHAGNSYVVLANDGSVWRSNSEVGNFFIRRAAPSTSALRGATLVQQGTRLLVVGDSGAIFLSSDIQGGSWSSVLSGTSADLRSVDSNGNSTVAVGANGTILRAGADGAGWSRVNLSETRAFHAVVHDANFQYLAVGEGGSMWRGDGSGLNWTNVSGITTASLRAATTIGDPGLSAVVVGDNGAIFYSSGAFTNWQAVNSPVGSALNAVAFTGADLIAAGEFRTTLWSQIGLSWTLAPVPAEAHTWGRIKQQFHQGFRSQAAGSAPVER